MRKKYTISLEVSIGILIFKITPRIFGFAIGVTLCMNSNNTSQPVLRIRLKVVNFSYKATHGRLVVFDIRRICLLAKKGRKNGEIKFCLGRVLFSC